MKKLLLASAIAASAVAMSSASFATGGAANRNMVPEFGPSFEMQMSGHAMHMQIIQDDGGNKFVVLPMDDAEQIFGTLSAHVASKFR